MEFKMTKMEQIRFIISMLPYYILGMLNGIWLALKAYIQSYVIMYRAIKNHTAVCYTGVKEGSWNFYKTFMLKQKPIVLHTNEGNLMMIHGSPSNKIPFVIAGHPASEIEALSDIQAGNYILVSCHNQYHNDIDWNGIKAIKEPNTITKYPILALLNPFNGKIYMTSSKEVGEMYSNMNSLPLSLMEEGFDNTIWKNVEPSVRILSEDEVPDSVKEKIKNKNNH